MGKTSKSSGKIKISWQMTSPPLAPTSWLPVDFAAAASASDEAAVERTLAWPEQTIGVLRAAFAQGLGRTTGWKLGKSAAAAATAASVFKRGVGLRSSGEAPKARKSSGAYEIVFPEEDPTGELMRVVNAFNIVDANVAAKWPQVRNLPNCKVIAVSEITKNLSTVAEIYAAGKTFPHWHVLGGGVLCDTAGFAAALAGVPMTFVATTLLAMADACVGGKTGVNFEPYGKNQVGRFYFPNLVIAWRGWLETLPPRELSAGISECLKHGFLSGNDRILQAGARQPEVLAEVVRVKAEVVAEDPTEKGKRAVLNFGHTLGHALESYSHRHNPRNYLLHGEAVAYGMVFATLLSQKFAGLSQADAVVIIGTLRAAGCVRDAATLAQHLGTRDLRDEKTWDELVDFMIDDKKVVAGKSQWVLLEALGAPLPEGGRFTKEIDLASLAPQWAEFVATLDS